MHAPPITKPHYDTSTPPTPLQQILTNITKSRFRMSARTPPPQNLTREEAANPSLLNPHLLACRLNSFACLPLVPRPHLIPSCSAGQTTQHLGCKSGGRSRIDCANPRFRNSIPRLTPVRYGVPTSTLPHLLTRLTFFVWHCDNPLVRGVCRCYRSLRSDFHCQRGAYFSISRFGLKGKEPGVLPGLA